MHLTCKKGMKVCRFLRGNKVPECSEVDRYMFEVNDHQVCVVNVDIMSVLLLFRYII